MTITGRDAEFKATIEALYREELGRDPDPGGLAAWLEQCRNGMTGDELRKALHDSPEGVAHRNKPKPPPPPALPHLEVRDKDFVDETGQPICHSGIDQFIAFRMFLDGRVADLEALVAESHEFGFRWWRVFLMGSKNQNTIFDLSPNEPGYYDKLREFPRWLNDRGIGHGFQPPMSNFAIAMMPPMIPPQPSHFPNESAPSARIRT